jgi:hypothetical protein
MLKTIQAEESLAAEMSRGGFRPTTRWFFPALATLLLICVSVGFARTFYLRSLFDVPPIPIYLYVHGVVLTAWFVLVFVQTGLVAAHRTDLHRRLGVAGAVIAVLVLLINPLVVVWSVPRLVAEGMTPARMEGIVIPDLVGLVGFGVLVAAGLRYRRQPEAHKRLMIFACLLIVGPALARLRRLGLPLPQLALMLAFPLFLLLYDLTTKRRFHWATIVGVLLFASSIVISIGLVGSDTAHAIVDAMR